MQTISENTPNIIVITGDLIDMNHTNMDTVLDFVKNAIQIAPIYYVPGNHEAALSQYDKLKEELKSVGVIVLEDKAVQLENNGSTVTLIGLSDPNFAIRNDVFDETPAMVSTKLNDLLESENDYTILLSHRPELFETYVDGGIDLVFSGHVHGAVPAAVYRRGGCPQSRAVSQIYRRGIYRRANNHGCQPRLRRAGGTHTHFEYARVSDAGITYRDRIKIHEDRLNSS